MKSRLKIQVERIHRLESEGPLKGFADISIADTFLIKGLRIVQGKDGLFVSLPKQRSKDGTWYNTIHLLNKEMKEKLADIVLSAYEE